MDRSNLNHSCDEEDVTAVGGLGGDDPSREKNSVNGVPHPHLSRAADASLQSTDPDGLLPLEVRLRKLLDFISTMPDVQDLLENGSEAEIRAATTARIQVTKALEALQREAEDRVDDNYEMPDDSSDEGEADPTVWFLERARERKISLWETNTYDERDLFVERMRDLLECFPIPFTELKQVLGEILMGSIKIWYSRNKEEFTDWEQFLNCLEKMFESVDADNEIRNRLSSRKQTEFEPVKSFIVEISRLNCELSKPLSEQELLAQLKLNLNDEYLEYILMVEINTINELEKYCEMMEPKVKEQELPLEVIEIVYCSQNEGVELKPQNEAFANSNEVCGIKEYEICQQENVASTQFIRKHFKSSISLINKKISNFGKRFESNKWVIAIKNLSGFMGKGHFWPSKLNSSTTIFDTYD